MAATKCTEFIIVNRRTGKALQAAGIENGCAVTQAEIDRSEPQIWQSSTVKGGVKLINKASSKALDVMMSGTDSGTWAQIWEDVGSESQIWKTAGRTYKTLTHISSGKVLDIADMSEEDGANAQLWESIGGDNQQWKLCPLQEQKAASTVKKTTVKKSAPRKRTAKSAKLKIEN